MIFLIFATLVYDSLSFLNNMIDSIKKIPLIFNTDDYDRLLHLCEHKGVSMPEYCRQKIITDIKRFEKFKEFKKTLQKVHVHHPLLRDKIWNPTKDALETTQKTITHTTKKTTKKTSQVFQRAKEPVQKVGGKIVSGVSATGSLVLASPIALALDRYLAKTLEGSATTFDRAMDAVYAVDKTGGAYHRLFDGHHDVMGAWKAIAQAHPDNSWIENASGTIQALWKDIATPNGIPYVTLDKAKFDGLKETLHQSYGIPKTKVYDAVSLNGTELMGATIGAIAILFQWKTKDIKTFSEIVFSMGLSAAVALNPLLLMVTLVSLARAFHLSKKHGKSSKEIAKGGLKGLILSGSFLTIIGLLSGPIWLNLLIGLVSLFVLRYLYSKAEEQMPALVNHISDQIKLLIVGQLPLVQYHFQRLSQR